MTSIENIFLEDIEILDLVRKIYANLKKRAKKETRASQQVLRLLQNRFEIVLRKIDDTFRGGVLDLLFYKNQDADSVNPNIILHDYSKRNYTEEEWEFGVPDSDHEDFQRFLYDTSHFPEIHGLSEPDFILVIPCFLLSAPNLSFIVDYILDKNFRIERFKGLDYQRTIGKLRIQALNNDLRTFLSTESGKIGTSQISEVEKGNLIGEYFRLLGFEVLIIDVLKETPVYAKLKNIQDVDVIAISYATQGLILIEEKPKFQKKDSYKLKSLQFLLQVFPFLGRPENWRVTYLLIGRTSGLLAAELTEIAKDENVVFWTPDTFKKNLSLLLDPNLELKSTIRFDRSRFNQPNYNRIYSNSMRNFLGDAKRPIFNNS